MRVTRNNSDLVLNSQLIGGVTKAIACAIDS